MSNFKKRSDNLESEEACHLGRTLVGVGVKYCLNCLSLSFYSAWIYGRSLDHFYFLLLKGTMILKNVFMIRCRTKCNDSSLYHFSYYKVKKLFILTFSCYKTFTMEGNEGIGNQGILIQLEVSHQYNGSF